MNPNTNERIKSVTTSGSNIANPLMNASLRKSVTAGDVGVESGVTLSGIWPIP